MVHADIVQAEARISWGICIKVKREFLSPKNFHDDLIFFDI